MPYGTDDHTGARIARARKRRNLTQRELADLSHVSYSAVTKIEQGKMPASPSVTGAFARALSVNVTELTGQPYLDELRADQLDALINPIREVLDVYDLGPAPDVRPRSDEELAAEADRLCALMRETNIKQVATELPSLIEEATTAAHTDGTRQAWQTLAVTYRTAYDAATKLGFVDLASIALDRMEWAAQRASDPILSGMRQYMRALAYLRASDYLTGQRLIHLGLGLAEQAEAGLERDVLTGQLNLGASVLAARDKDADRAEGHLQEADRLARRTGPAERVRWLSFGPANVGVHRVSVQAELDLYPEAISLAKTLVIPEDWTPSRLAHHYAEVARAQLWVGRTDAAFKNLLKARRLAPQQTRYLPLVRETYAGLAHAKRATPDTFSNFGSWLGM